MNKQDIGTILKELRGNTPAPEVAAACGISVSALYMYESGKRIPRDQIKIRLAHYYKTTVSRIFYAAKDHDM
jgi:transcriptional regulator with XRE-family HTH domain|nr:MAG TPA: hypothetical protein [Caudoviricetes sp.]